MQLPQQLPLKMANRSAEDTSQEYVLCCGCQNFHECAVDSCKLVLRFGFLWFISLHCRLLEVY